jgi:membrane protease YdiL (CAAX protease family)
MRHHFPGMTPQDLDQLRQVIARVPLSTMGVLALIAVVVGPTIGSVTAFGEEVAWRGYVLQKVESLGFWRAASFTGALQAIWHYPFVFFGFFYPGQNPFIGCVLLTMQILMFSFLMTYLTMRAKSVLAATIFHGVAGPATQLAHGLCFGSALLIGVSGLTTSLAMIPIVIAMWVHDRFIAKESII